MPERPWRPCHAFGCPPLTREKYCPAHAGLARQEEAARRRDYDDHLISNWLPAPNGRFSVNMWMYLPKATALDPFYVPPGIQNRDQGSA